jgi:hypothetical protein
MKVNKIRLDGIALTAMRVLRSIGLITIVLVLLAALALCIYRWDVAGSERPSDKALIKTFTAHRAELAQARCEIPSSEVARSRLSAIGAKFTSCDYDNTLRLGFDGNRLGLAIGPGWVKGLTHIPGDLNREGVLVASTDGTYRWDANVYLRPLGSGWFIFFQRDD